MTFVGDFEVGADQGADDTIAGGVQSTNTRPVTRVRRPLRVCWAMTDVMWPSLLSA
jgi:hypothetical protein